MLMGHAYTAEEAVDHGVLEEGDAGTTTAHTFR